LANLKKNLVYNFLLSFSQVLLPLISVPYLSRVLDPGGIGKVSFIDSFTYYFISIAEFGIAIYGMRAVARLRENSAERGKLVSELLGLHVITSSITLLLYGLSVFFAWKHIQDIRLVLFSLAYLLINFLACEWYFIGMEKFRYITLRSLLIRLIGLVAIFVLIKVPADYYIYYGIIVCAAVVTFSLNIYYLFKEVKVSFKAVDLRKHIAHTRVIYFISLAYGITWLLDNVYLRLMSTAAAVGYYAFSMKIVRMSTALITDSLQVFFPRIVALLQDDTSDGPQRVLLRNLQLLVFFAVPLSVGLFLTADQLVTVFLGNQFLPAIADARLLAIFPCIKAYNLFLGNQVLIAYNKEKAYLVSLLVSGGVFTVLALSLSWYFADRGACVALLVAELVTLVMNLYYVKRLVKGLQIFDGLHFVYALSVSLLFIPVVYGVRQLEVPLIGQLSLSIAACVLVYVLTQLFIVRNSILLVIKTWMGGKA
jgi:O-antigen/teichoic acid export membrane protein